MGGYMDWAQFRRKMKRPAVVFQPPAPATEPGPDRGGQGAADSESSAGHFASVRGLRAWGRSMRGCVRGLVG